MFIGEANDVPPTTGKRIYGMPSRKDQAFSLGWENQPQLNHFQQRMNKNKEVTSKITTQATLQGKQQPKSLIVSPQLQAKDYERIFYENPNITQEQLQKITAQYDQYRGSLPSRSSKQDPSDSERRQPIRPRENMKDIIYNGVGVGQEVRGNSRRNNSNYKPESYNYYGKN